MQNNLFLTNQQERIIELMKELVDLLNTNPELKDWFTGLDFDFPIHMTVLQNLGEEVDENE